MKIFNWVHRKLKDGSAAQNAKSTNAISDESGDANQFLVDNNAFVDSVFGCWKGGILTIGTFGYDPLTKYAAEVDEQDYDRDLEFHVDDQGHESEELEWAENDESITDSEEEEVDDEDEEEEEEANPLMYAVYAHDYEALLQQYDPAADYIKTNGNKDFDHVMMVMEEHERDVDADKKKDRITLADLLSADHWDDDELQKKQKLHELMEEKASSKKQSHGRLAFAKKLLLARDSKDARPIHKLHRLMRKMLKRKIHPVNKEVNESNMEYIPKVNESVPLLPITQAANGA
ncbi:protein TILLER ANGLE CONTROL 1-like isoform X2 [Primulina huaijiensis]|uniref:protein TILLER ANGLE CONTROL 1-like isoform X2 n=1 Tax=Primulina huaijiensis TaxID=1492673 RepID=UPI003CC6E21E